MARQQSAVSLCVKYTLFLWNFILWLVSMAVTALGAYILVIKHKKVHDAIDFLFDPSTVMCTIGSIAVVVTLIGWLGALREYTSCLRLYTWMMTLFFVGEIILIVFVFVFYFVPEAKQKLGLFPEKTFQDAIEKYGVVEDDDMRNLIDSMQESLECCGFSDSDTGYFDWDKNEYYKCINATTNNPERCSVPHSCCKLQPGQMKNVLCGRGVMKATSGTLGESDSHNPIYKIGCLKAVGNFINEHAMVIGGVMLGILIPQMYFMYLSRTLREQVLTQRAKWGRSTK
ncbi:TSN33-like protein [Mya arenaria]|uniref:Tetraspanin n=1 Tax=Mya arenaria TaxID=6604 RepID=A0ABY7FHQ8_MYAAR|nr:tetraspanin-33-like [Mya arenaria]WAR21615.1 TSN33-like protein [Mya arenaria]